MKQDMIDLLKNCLTAMNNATEEDIAREQVLFDEEVKKSELRSKNNLFEPIYYGVPFSDEELVKLLGQKFMDTLTNLKWILIHLF